MPLGMLHIIFTTPVEFAYSQQVSINTSLHKKLGLPISNHATVRTITICAVVVLVVGTMTGLNLWCACGDVPPKMWVFYLSSKYLAEINLADNLGQQKLPG